jgi:hypothetical protein
VYGQEVETPVAINEDNDSQTDYLVDIHKAKAVLLKAILWMKIHALLECDNRLGQTNIWTFPFLQASTDTIFMLMGTPSISGELADHHKRLDDNLASWQLTREPMDGDGDCLFSAIAFGMLQPASNNNAHVLGILPLFTDSQGTDTSIEQIVPHLRQALVAEWSGPNSAEYQNFLAATQLLVEAPRFLQKGVFCCELGDLVITALANVLRIPIVVFTSVQNFPMTTIVPTYNVAGTSEPICIALTQYGGGHYDAVIQMAAMDYDELEQEEPHCTCGRKKASKSWACTATELAYSTRCPCYKAARPCTHRCRCKDCHNSYGKIPKPDVVPKAKRTRAHFQHQQHLLRGRKGQQFMLAAGEVPKTGPWTYFEFLVATAILREISCDDMEVATSTAQAVRAVAVALNLKAPLPHRSTQELQRLFRHCMHKSAEANKLLQ